MKKLILTLVLTIVIVSNTLAQADFITFSSESPDLVSDQVTQIEENQTKRVVASSNSQTSDMVEGSFPLSLPKGMQDYTVKEWMKTSSNRAGISFMLALQFLNDQFNIQDQTHTTPDIFGESYIGRRGLAILVLFPVKNTNDSLVIVFSPGEKNASYSIYNGSSIPFSNVIDVLKGFCYDGFYRNDVADVQEWYNLAMEAY